MELSSWASELGSSLVPLEDEEEKKRGRRSREDDGGWRVDRAPETDVRTTIGEGSEGFCWVRVECRPKTVEAYLRVGRVLGLSTMKK